MFGPLYRQYGDNRHRSMYTFWLHLQHILRHAKSFPNGILIISINIGDTHAFNNIVSRYCYILIEMIV